MTAQYAPECLLPNCRNTTWSDDGFCHQHDADDLAAFDRSTLSDPRSSVIGSAEQEDVEDLRSPTVQLHPEQQEIRDKALEVFVSPDEDRCQLRVPCGVGKTMAAQAALDAYSDHLVRTEGRGGTFLVVVPTIALARQVRQDFEQDGVMNLSSEHLLSVHEQSKDIDQARRAAGARKGDAALQADVDMVRSFLDDDEESGYPRVVIAVTDSVHKVISAQEQGAPDMDATVFDEAHNVAGLYGDSMTAQRMLFNEQQNGLRSTNRMFMTATPRYPSDDMDFRRQLNRVPGAAKDKIVKVDASVDAERDSGKKKPSGRVIRTFLTQSDEEVFGRTIVSFGYQDAIAKGYLSYPHVVRSRLEMSAERKNTSLSRDTPVDADGRVSKDGGMTAAAWVSTASTIRSLVVQDEDEVTSLANAPSTPAPAPSATAVRGRNVLVFSDSVDQAVSVEQNWKDVALAMSRKEARRDMAAQEARRVLDDPSSKPDQVLGARYRLVADHASVVSVSSTSRHTARQREEAFDHFDSRKPYDSAPCTCGARRGSWCACARVVSNVDMMSEGISIKSVDTVVMNRPRMGNDRAVYQAIGRSSRIWRDEDGNSHKASSRVVVPEVTYSDGGRPARYAMSEDYASLVGSLSRIGRDTQEARRTGGHQREDLRLGTETLFDHLTTRPNDIAWEAYSADPEGDWQSAAYTNARALVQGWDATESEAVNEYRRSNGIKGPVGLSTDERERLTYQYARTNGTSSSRPAVVAMSVLVRDGVVDRQRMDQARMVDALEERFVYEEWSGLGHERHPRQMSTDVEGILSETVRRHRQAG